MSKNIGKLTTLLVWIIPAMVFISSFMQYDMQLDKVANREEKHVCLTEIGKKTPECIELSLSIKAEAETGLKVKSQPKQ